MSATPCACGCGQFPEGEREYIDGAHKQRAYRKRKRERADTPCTPGCPERGYCKQHDRVNRPARPVRESTGGGGKRVRYWDPDHAGSPGSWEQFWELHENSARPAVPRYERSSDWAPLRGLEKHERRGIPRDRWLEVDGNQVKHTAGPLDADIAPPDGLWFAGRLERTAARPGIEALRRAISLEGKPQRHRQRPRTFTVDVVDGWVRIRQAARVEPIYIDVVDDVEPDEDLRRAA
jgi:hypothetical protein